MADQTSAPPKPSSSVKLVLLGEAAVGKSSLVLRFVNNDFQENKEPTIGAAFLTQKCTLPTRTIKFEIWDTAGQERFASLAPMYYRNAQSALVVYDLTKPSSLIKARHWVAELQRQASPGIVIALVGNKVDLVGEEEDDDNNNNNSSSGGRGNNTASEEEESNDNGEGEDASNTAGSGDAQQQQQQQQSEGTLRKISIKEGRGYAEEEGLLFFETSAKSGANVQEVFEAIANAIPETSMKGRNNNNTTAGAAGGQGGAGGTDRVNLRQVGKKDGGDGCAC